MEIEKHSLNRFQELDQPTYDYLLRNGVRENPVLAELRAVTRPLAGAQMQIGPDQGSFMKFMVETLGARQVLELGTYTGYSSLCMALGLPADGKLITCDVDAEVTKIAQKHWQKAGVAEKIELRLGPGLATLEKLIADGRSGTFDLAFIDADKPNYPKYFELCLTLLRRGGVIMIDNVYMGSRFERGDNERGNGKAVHELNLKLKNDERVELSMLAIGDGLTLARKK